MDGRSRILIVILRVPMIGSAWFNPSTLKTRYDPKKGKVIIRGTWCERVWLAQEHPCFPQPPYPGTPKYLIASISGVRDCEGGSIDAFNKQHCLREWNNFNWYTNVLYQGGRILIVYTPWDALGQSSFTIGPMGDYYFRDNENPGCQRKFYNAAEDILDCDDLPGTAGFGGTAQITEVPVGGA